MVGRMNTAQSIKDLQARVAKLEAAGKEFRAQLTTFEGRLSALLDLQTELTGECAKAAAHILELYRIIDRLTGGGGAPDPRTLVLGSGDSA
jgi:hypothetical protein